MRPAVWRFGALAVVVACWTGSQTGSTIGNRNAPSAEDGLVGAYRCSISEGGFDYPPYACEIRVTDDRRTILVKLEGTTRIEGEIHPTARGFRFAGRYFCTEGDCTQQIHGEFVLGPDGVYQGRFTESPQMVVSLVRAGKAGGSSYGGIGYGGSIYGGAVYGGARYGGHRRNRRP
jgi:hypothetical protein